RWNSSDGRNFSGMARTCGSPTWRKPISSSEGLTGKVSKSSDAIIFCFVRNKNKGRLKYTNLQIASLATGGADSIRDRADSAGEIEVENVFPDAADLFIEIQGVFVHGVRLDEHFP